MSLGRIFKIFLSYAIVAACVASLQSAGLALRANAQSSSFSQELSTEEREELRAIGLDLNAATELGITDTLVLPELPEGVKIEPGSVVPFSVEQDQGLSSLLNDLPLQVVPGERTEDEIKGISDPVLREKVLRSLAVDQACNTASLAWFRTLRDLGGNSSRVRFVDILRKAKRTDPARAIREAADYDQDCLRRRNAFEGDLQAAGIQQVVGVLYIRDLPRCSALRVAQDLFITARHCLYDKDTGRKNVDVDDLSLALAHDAFQTSYKVLGAQSDRLGTTPVEQAYTTSRDYIYLRSSPVAIGMPAIKFQAPTTGAQVTLAGYFVSTGSRNFWRTSRTQCSIPNGPTDSASPILHNALSGKSAPHAACIIVKAMRGSVDQVFLTGNFHQIRNSSSWGFTSRRKGEG